MGACEWQLLSWHLRRPDIIGPDLKQTTLQTLATCCKGRAWHVWAGFSVSQSMPAMTEAYELKNTLIVFILHRWKQCSSFLWHHCLQFTVEIEELNSAVVVVVCLPAYIVIYLRALNWTSYSFGPHWSHSRVELYQCTLGDAGIWSYRVLQFDVCSCRAYAAPYSINKHTIPWWEDRVEDTGELISG